MLLLLGWMGLIRDWRVALAIESLSMLFGFATFLIPDSLGIKEGGLALTFSALALPVSAGLAVAIAFRITSLVGTLVGLLVMSGSLTRIPAGTAKTARAGKLVSQIRERKVLHYDRDRRTTSFAQ